MPWQTGCVGTGNAADVATIGGIVCIIRNLLGIVAPLLGLVALGVIIYSGARMIMGADNPKEVAAAQQSLTFAIIGLLGLGLSWLILVVIKNLTGADVLTLPSF